MDDNKAISLQNLMCAIDNNNYKFKQWVLDTLLLIQKNINDNVSNHIDNTIIHVTQDDKDLWDATLQNAKDYAKKLFDSVTSFTIEIVDALPTEDIKTMTIYFMRNKHDNESDYYEEYMYINNKWEIIGSTFINLAPYLLKEDFEKYQQEIVDKFAKYNTSDEIINILKDYLLTQTFNDTIKNYTTTEALQKLLEEYAKTEDIHTHENKDIIDKLSESTDGNLLFNGQEIKGGSDSDITISKEDNNAIQQKDDGIFVEDKTEQINNIQSKLDNINIVQNNTKEKAFGEDILWEGSCNTNRSIKSINLSKSYQDYDELIFYLDYNNNNIVRPLYRIISPTLINKIRNSSISNSTVSMVWGYYNYEDYCDILKTSIDTRLDITSYNMTLVKIVGRKYNQIVIDPVEYINTSQGIEDTPVGHIISYMGNTAPKHYLICDGTEYNITDYPYLAQHFKDEFGSYNYFGGDGTTTFAVPELSEPSKLTKISPIMTSDTAPSPYKVTRSSVWHSTSDHAWRVFDEVKTGSEDYTWIPAANELNPWICVDLGTKTKITSFKLWLDTGKNKFPEDFTLQGSNDGANFTNIKSFTNVSSMTQAFDGEIEFNLGKIAEYRYYKIYVDTLQITGSSTYVRIYEWEMFYQDSLHRNCIKYEPTYYMNVTQTISLEEANELKEQNQLLKKQNQLLQQEIEALNVIIDSNKTTI